MNGTPVPFLPKRYVERTLGLSASFDAGRGCPYQCSFCTIINVQGRKSRFRSADDIEHLVRLNWAQGIHRFFITDDNFARNEEWEEIFDRLIELREKHGIPLGLMIQVDTLCHKIDNFIVKAKRAGVTRVFIGLENVNPDNLAAAKKRQNKITEYRKMLLAWKVQGIITLAGYILGFPADTPATIRRDIAIIQKELAARHHRVFPADAAAGLGGSSGAMEERRRDGRRPQQLRCGACLHRPCQDERKGMGGDLPRGLDALLHAGAHGDAVAARGRDRGADGQSRQAPGRVRGDGSARKSSSAAERPFRLKHPSERRPGLPPRKRLDLLAAFFLRDRAASMPYLAGMIVRLIVLKMSITRDPRARAYMDPALTPVGDDNDVTLDLMTKTTGAGAAVAHIRKVAELTGAAAVN